MYIYIYVYKGFISCSGCELWRLYNWGTKVTTVKSTNNHIFTRVSDPLFLPGSGTESGFQIYPDPVFKFLWIQIRGFSQPTDPGAKTECRESSKSYLL